MEPKKTVKVSVLKENDRISVIVRNGGKIKARILESIFIKGKVDFGERDHDGSHVALATARAELRKDNGDIEISNDLSSNEVVAKLIIPQNEEVKKCP